MVPLVGLEPTHSPQSECGDFTNLPTEALLWCPVSVSNPHLQGF